MCMILAMNIFQQDGPVKALSYCTIANIIVTQSMKRFMHRKRPCDFQPPRAHRLLFGAKDSSMPSRVVISSTSFIFVMLTANNWIGSMKWLNGVELWVGICAALGTYLLSSFTRVHLGQCYPSDILISIVPTSLVFGIYFLFSWLDSLSLLCPSCSGSKHGFCYYGDLPETILITRQSFDSTQLNFASTLIICVAVYIIYSVVSWHPIEFWHKLPYFVPNLLALYLFNNILLCPNESNNY